jgi:DsbC/DsbD-like thiol-disulfide interchange protein
MRNILIGSVVVFLFLAALTVAFSSGSAALGMQQNDSQVKLAATAGKIDKDGRQMITVKMHINDGWHAYANPVKNEDLEPNQTVVKVASPKKLQTVTVDYPKGQRHMTGKETYQVYEGSVEISASVVRVPGDTGPLEVTVSYVTCNDKKGICLPPESVKLEVK